MFKKIIQILTLIISVASLVACGKPQETPVETITQNTPASTPTQQPGSDKSPSSSNSILVPVEGNYEFTEGPAVDQSGNVYFSDINAGKIYRWSTDGSVKVFLEGLSSPNGLAFDGNGNLIACEGSKGRLISIDPQGSITVLADQFDSTRFNEPKDLWIAPQGGIYFTDPAFQSPVVQGGEYVYYLAPDRSRVTRVINDMVRPNGIVGTGDGKTLYVADYGAGQTFAYDINPDGSLSNKRLFVSVGSDGMDMDASGDLYLTTPNQVRIFDATGNSLLDIPIQENPTNIAFGGADHHTLFITARTAVYTLQMPAGSSNVAWDPAAATSTSGFTLTSPTVVEGGTLPAEYTCDGTSASLALAWSGAPAGTQSYAVVMNHVASPEDVHWYWVLYNIPASVTSLSKKSTDIGILGNNSMNGKTAYTPPCSKGPGPKVYTYTVYALSAEPNFSVPAAQVNRMLLLEAIQNITLASAELHVTYTRK